MDRPYEKIIAAAQERVRDSIEECAAEKYVGDTPIEQVLYVALRAYVYHEWCEYDGLFVAKSDEDFERKIQLPFAERYLHLRPQAQLQGWRVDFLLAAWNTGYFLKTAPGWRKLIIECDGHDFHERTKEQAAKDSARSREWQDKGYGVFRFTGSEIWRDPWGCAEGIVNWATRGL